MITVLIKRSSKGTYFRYFIKKKLKSFLKKIAGMCGIGPKPAQLVMIRIHVKIIPGPKDFQLNEKMSPITL